MYVKVEQYIKDNKISLQKMAEKFGKDTHQQTQRWISADCIVIKTPEGKEQIVSIKATSIE